MFQLTIKGQQFEIADDPAVIVGAIMNEGHVHSLQQTRRENIRNNFAARVEKALGDAEQLAPESLQQLQQELQDYAAHYQFGVRASGPRRVVDPVEKEMLRMAKEDIAAAYFSRKGERLKGEALTEAAERLLGLKGEEYNRRARRALRDREAAAAEVLNSVGIAA